MTKVDSFFSQQMLTGRKNQKHRPRQMAYLLNFMYLKKKLTEDFFEKSIKDLRINMYHISDLLKVDPIKQSISQMQDSKHTMTHK